MKPCKGKFPVDSFGPRQCALTPISAEKREEVGTGGGRRERGGKTRGWRGCVKPEPSAVKVAEMRAEAARTLQIRGLNAAFKAA